MAYSFEQFQREYYLERITELLQQDEDFRSRYLEAVCKHLSPEKIFSRFLDDEQLRQPFLAAFFSRLSRAERLELLTREQRLRGLTVAERLEGLTVAERLEGLTVAERLEGLTVAEIQAYLNNLEDN